MCFFIFFNYFHFFAFFARNFARLNRIISEGVGRGLKDKQGRTSYG